MRNKWMLYRPIILRSMFIIFLVICFILAVISIEDNKRHYKKENIHLKQIPTENIVESDYGFNIFTGTVGLNVGIIQF